ncbi:hypothetical protein HYY75_05035 [bacterium]|nr:hypothetical protein [bacterium]
MKNPIGPFEKDLLRLTNVCLEEDIEIKFTLVNDGIKSFYDCLERSKGRFNLAFFLLPDFAPFAVVPMEGYIDDSGILEKAVSLMDECKFENALEILCILRKKNPNLHQVAFNIGVAYQKLALAGFSFNENRFNAVRFFQEELSLNPHSALAMNNIEEIEKLRGNLEGSIRWLELAINEAPASLRILSNLIKSRVLLCQKSKSSTAQILEKIEPELGRCFQIHPEHRITQELLRTLSKIFDFEFLRKNPFFPVDFRYA